MKRYEVIPGPAGVSLKVFASTKAGLAIAALQGLFAAAEPKYTHEEGAGSERSFKIEAEDFPAMVAAILTEAIAVAAANKEAYVDIRFNLITDKKTEGAFIGKPVRGLGTDIRAVKGVDMPPQKNEKGEWEATITFEGK